MAEGELVDPNSDEELADTPTGLLRQYLRYWHWPKSEQHHFEKYGEHVDRHRQIERITLVIERRDDRGPGRPIGFVPSEETRSAISYARREVKLAEEITRGQDGPNDGGSWPAPPPCDDPRVPLEARLQAAIRENYQCSGCREHYRIRFWKKPGDKTKYWREVKDGKLVVEIQHHQDIKCWLARGGDPWNPEHVLLLCSFCRDTAQTGGVKMLGISLDIGAQEVERG